MAPSWVGVGDPGGHQTAAGVLPIDSDKVGKALGAQSGTDLCTGTGLPQPGWEEVPELGVFPAWVGGQVGAGKVWEEAIPEGCQSPDLILSCGAQGEPETLVGRRCSVLNLGDFWGV